MCWICITPTTHPHPHPHHHPPPKHHPPPPPPTHSTHPHPRPHPHPLECIRQTASVIRCVRYCFHSRYERVRGELIWKCVYMDEKYTLVILPPIDGLIKDCSITTAYALVIAQSCTKPSIRTTSHISHFPLLKNNLFTGEQKVFALILNVLLPLSASSTFKIYFPHILLD